MSLPFTQEQFLQVMQRYNEALWPAPVALNALALAAVAALGIRRPGRHVFIAGVLALLWAWSAVCYHFLYFYEINPAAALFGAMFLAAGGALRLAGRVRAAPAVRAARGATHFHGRCARRLCVDRLPVSATAIRRCRPSACHARRRSSPSACLRSSGRRTRGIASQAVFLSGMVEDLGLLPAGLVGLWLAWRPAQGMRLA